MRFLGSYVSSSDNMFFTMKDHRFENKLFREDKLIKFRFNYNIIEDFDHFQLNIRIALDLQQFWEDFVELAIYFMLFLCKSIKTSLQYGIHT